MPLDRMRPRGFGVLTVLTLCALAMLASTARSSLAAVPKGCPSVRAHAGKTSGDWEVAFGRRKTTGQAVALLRRVRRKGFRCAVIERERRTHEVAIVGLHTRAAALRIFVRARRLGLRVSIAES